jgi:hypothetical protein
MSDSTDSAFGFILFILFLALLGYAAGGVSSYSSTAGTTSGTTTGTHQGLPPLSGDQVKSCSGTLKQDVSDSSTSPSLNLKVYQDPMDPGIKCATATRLVSGSYTVKVTLAYTADKSQKVSNTDDDQAASVQVTGTNNYCVSALAEISGIGTRVAIQKVVQPCTMTVPAMYPANPVPGVPTRTDDKEDEEGY